MTVAEIMGCASATNKRAKNDFYVTPAWCTEALVRVETPYLNEYSSIWEPCAGHDDITNVLRAAGWKVATSDIAKGVDFLKLSVAPSSAILTNPPYSLATAFIRHAHHLGIRYHAWLLKADFLNALRAVPLVKDIGYPARIWALTERPDFLGQGNPTMNCSWYVWSGRSKRTSFKLLSQSTCRREAPLSRRREP